MHNTMGITKSCTQLHPAPSTSTQLISTITQLHLPPPNSFQHPSSSPQHPQQYLNQNIARNWAISTERWHAWYFGGVESKSRLRFLKFQPQSLFLGKSRPKNSKLSVLSKSCYTWCLKDADSYSSISFLNFKS